MGSEQRAYIRINCQRNTKVMIKKLLTAVMCLAMLSLAGCGFDGGPIITEKTFADHKIRHGGDFDDTAPLSLKVIEALKQNPRTKYSQIHVSTFKEGGVKLSGFVNNEQLVEEALQTAAKVDGVTSVANALYIR